MNDLLFVVYNINGQLRLFDIAFNQIDLTYMTRYNIGFKSLTDHLNPNIHTYIDAKPNSTISTSLNRLVGIVSSKQLFTNSLWTCFHFSKGPFGLFRLALPENFNAILLATHFIKNAQVADKEPDLSSISVFKSANKEYDCDLPFVSKKIDKAVNLLKMLNWDKDGNTCLTIMYKILNFLLSYRVVFTIKTDILVEEVLATFYKPKRALLEKTIYEFRYQVSRCARRYFYTLLKNSSLNKAFLLAVDIGSKDLFNDLYYCALDKYEFQLAEMSRKRFHELQAEENQDKLRAELNRSATTIDDNLKGAYSEFDKYSLSSSEPDSIGSNDNQSYTSDVKNQVDFECLNEAEKFLVQQQKLNKKFFKKVIEKQPLSDGNNARTVEPVAFGEEEIESFAKGLMIENYFINQFNYD